jgi:hypothetical protein
VHHKHFLLKSSMRKLNRTWFATIVFVLCLQTAFAQVITMDVTLGSNPTQVFTGANAQILLDRAIGIISATQNSGTAVLNYPGHPNAITLNFVVTPGISNTVGSSVVTLSIPGSGITRTFTNSTTTNLTASVNQVVKAATLPRLQPQAVAAASLVAINDGTPHSSTALLATRIYDQFGIEESQTREEKESPAQEERKFGLAIAPEAGWINASGFHGSAWRLPIDTGMKLSRRVDLRFDITPAYLEIEESSVYQLAMSLALPVKIIFRTRDCPWMWRVTPSFGSTGAWSKDLNTGGWVIEEGLTSLAGYDFKCFTLSMGNQISLFQSTPLSLGGYDFDPSVTQQILKNGLDLNVPLGRRWVAELYGIQTHFIRQAAIGDYFTVGTGVSYRFPPNVHNFLAKNGRIFVGFYSDIAANYNAPTFRLGSNWKF